MAEKYPDSGALFNNDKKKGNQPDYNGKISLSKETLERLLEIARSSGDATIYISGWTRVGRSGTRFMSLKASLPQGGGASGGGDDFMAPQQKNSRDDIGDDEIPF